MIVIYIHDLPMVVVEDYSEAEKFMEQVFDYYYRHNVKNPLIDYAFKDLVKPDRRYPNKFKWKTFDLNTFC